MCAYNSAAFIREAVDSILQQTLKVSDLSSRACENGERCCSWSISRDRCSLLSLSLSLLLSHSCCADFCRTSSL